MLFPGQRRFPESRQSRGDRREQDSRRGGGGVQREQRARKKNPASFGKNLITEVLTVGQGNRHDHLRRGGIARAGDDVGGALAIHRILHQIVAREAA